MNELLKKTGKHVAAILIFAVLCAVYFAPAVIDGKHISQGDDIKAQGMGDSQMKQYEETAEPGEFSVWSDAMFGGMPYVSTYGSPAPNLPSFRLLEKPIKNFGYKDAGMVLMGLVSFYILMCVMGMSWWLALLGSIAFALASYNLIIIQAGHVTKAYVIALMPLVLAGLKLLFDKKYMWGAMVLTLGIALSVANSHVQVTYYLMLLCVFIFLGFLAECIRQKAYKHLGIVVALCVGSIVLGALPNAQSFYSQWDLGQHSTRGATELTTTTPKGEKISSGLDKEYAFQWSYGKGEMLTLLVPNAYGGSSNATVDNTSAIYKTLKKNGMQVQKKMPAPVYWGDKPFTSGPVYMGAIVCFLFVLGMVVIKNRMKWWMLAGAVFLTFLAWGRNFDVFNDVMFHHMPMYNKFRTVEMALVIPGLVLPVVGLWGLKEVLDNNVEDKLLKKGLIVSTAITGGLCLIMWLVPGALLSFVSPNDSAMGLPDWYLDALAEDRASAASSDAARSLFFVVASAALLVWFYLSKRGTKVVSVVSAILVVLMLIDLWGIDRRYLNDDSYAKKSSFETYKESVADKAIKQDKDLSYRVLPLSNTFQDTQVSFYHHSIGGYHAAKLRRYQELIDHRLAAEVQIIISGLQTATTNEDLFRTFANCPSLNMLNTRYIIYNSEQYPLVNPMALGNAWFVKDYEIVDNADAEIAALDDIDPAEKAVVDQRFAAQLEGFKANYDEEAEIELVAYRPNRLTYKTRAENDQLAVFSEIYYNPGWNVTIDGVEAEHFRADWILRSMIVPAGEHEIVFEFRPQGFVTAAYITCISSFAILLLFVLLVGFTLYKKGKK